jgi:D-psicose/D-tagatose/L-ribulose 3-epimerase
MKTGMNLLLWGAEIGPEHDHVLDEIKAIGFESVEIPIFNISSLEPYERLGKRLKDLGLRATAVTVTQPETSPISPDRAVRDAAVAYLDRVLECGQAFGCEVLCGPTHSPLGHFSGNGPTEDEFKAGVESIQRAGDKAQARGIKIALEYLNRFENYFLTTAAQTATFVKAVGHPSVGMMYDSFHAHIEEKNQLTAILSCKDLIIHAHVSENDRGIPGSGQVYWGDYFEGLKNIGFDGFYTIEAFGRALPDLAAATRVWRDLFSDAFALCREGHDFIRRNAR